MESLEIHGGAAGLYAMLQRAQHLDAQAVLRLQQLGDSVNVFVTSPFDVIAARRVRGAASRDGAVLSVRDALRVETLWDERALSERAPDTAPPKSSKTPVTLTATAMDAAWPGALPPTTGFCFVDEVPAGVVQELLREGKQLARQFSGPLGPPASLLDQVVLQAQSSQDSALTADIPMRMIFALSSFGFMPPAVRDTKFPQTLRISTAGRWIRVDAPFGSVYRSTGLQLLM